MFGFNAFAAQPFCAIPIVTISPVIFDFHDGGVGKRKEEEQRRREAAKSQARRDEVLALYEQIVEGKPQVAEEIAEPFVIKQATKQAPADENQETLIAQLIN